MNNMDTYFKNNANTDYIDQVNKSHFVNKLTDSLFSISNQFNSTFSNSDPEDYIKSFLNDDVVKDFLNSDFIDEFKFFEWLNNEINERIFEFLGIDLKSKELIFTDLNPKEKFIKVYYNIYLNVAVKQQFIVDTFYKIFSYITAKQLEMLEKAIGKSITKNHSKLISKKFKLKSTNYVMDLSEILKDKESIKNIIYNTNLFDKHLQNAVYYKDDMPKQYIYEIFIRNSSRDEMVLFFENVFKFDDNLPICINNIEVYAITNNFEIRRYGDGRID